MSPPHLLRARAGREAVDGEGEVARRVADERADLLLQRRERPTGALLGGDHAPAALAGPCEVARAAAGAAIAWKVVAGQALARGRGGGAASSRPSAA